MIALHCPRCGSAIGEAKDNPAQCDKCGLEFGEEAITSPIIDPEPSFAGLRFLGALLAPPLVYWLVHLFAPRLQLLFPWTAGFKWPQVIGLALFGLWCTFSALGRLLNVERTSLWFLGLALLIMVAGADVMLFLLAGSSL